MSVSVAPQADPSGQQDRFVVLRGTTWEDYVRVKHSRGERYASRLTYLEGVLQIMSPSRSHEAIKSLIGRLVEVWCLEKGVEFSTYGSWTLEDQALDRAVEPDECYVFGLAPEPSRPDLAIEVVWTSGGIGTLEAYRGLGVREVWFWRTGVLTAYGLRDGDYVELEASEILAGIDLAQLASFLDRPTTSAAIRAYRSVLRDAG